MKKNGAENTKTFRDINVERDPDLNLIWAFISRLSSQKMDQLKRYGYPEPGDLFNHFMLYYPRIKSGYNNSKGSYSSYLYTCLTNEINRIFKHQNRQKRTEPEMVSLEEPISPDKNIPFKDTIVDPKTEQPLPNEGILQKVKDFANPFKLKPGEIDAILDTYEEGLTLQEQANNRGITCQAVFLRNKTALEKIRKKLARDKLKDIL